MDSLLKQYKFTEQGDGTIVSNSYNRCYRIAETGDRYECTAIEHGDDEGTIRSGGTPLASFLACMYDILEG